MPSPSFIETYKPRIDGLLEDAEHVLDTVWYNMMDVVEQDSREEGKPLTPSQEAWDGLVNLVNIKAPRKDIRAQEEAFIKIRDESSGYEDPNAWMQREKELQK